VALIILLLSFSARAGAETKAIDLLEQCMGAGPLPALQRDANIKLCHVQIRRFLDSVPVSCRWPAEITVEQMRFNYIKMTQNEPRLFREEATFALRAALPKVASCN